MEITAAKFVQPFPADGAFADLSAGQECLQCLQEVWKLREGLILQGIEEPSSFFCPIEQIRDAISKRGFHSILNNWISHLPGSQARMGVRSEIRDADAGSFFQGSVSDADLEAVNTQLRPHFELKDQQERLDYGHSLYFLNKSPNEFYKDVDSVLMSHRVYDEIVRLNEYFNSLCVALSTTPDNSPTKIQNLKATKQIFKRTLVAESLDAFLDLRRMGYSQYDLTK